MVNDIAAGYNCRAIDVLEQKLVVDQGRATIGDASLFPVTALGVELAATTRQIISIESNGVT